MASADKPLDVGSGVVCASFAGDGAWLSIGGLHPACGFVELSGLPPFDESDRGDPAATRRYRESMVEPRFAWLRVVSGDTRFADLHPVASADPTIVAWRSGSGAGPSAVAYARRGSRRVIQRWQLAGAGAVVRVAGRLDRPALTEITEIDPLAPTGARTELRAEGRRLTIAAPELPAAVAVDASLGRWTLVEDGAELRIGRDVETVELSVALEPSLGTPAAWHDAEASGPEPPAGTSEPADHLRAGVERIVGRALAYVRGCTALAAGDGERAIVTDHRLLPLSWTRDAYYQALLLLARDGLDDRAIVADHLRWLWRRCERVGGRWMRSHHGNGQPKDRAFQADQQLYPFVELADLWRMAGSLPDGVEWPLEVPRAWDAVLAAIDPATGLIGTDENAADDRAELPFVAGSQIVLWYAAMRLAEPELASRIGLEPAGMLEVAARVRAAFERVILTEGGWAYATDGRGRSLAYHDANDLPTALAPLWGFCTADDRGWRRTMEFAFSAANPGFVAGRDGGLGSAHTPGAWPLGHVQAWLVDRIRGDEAGATAALERLCRAAFEDGMLPESLEGGRGANRVRHWFAWPGAALGALWLLDQRGSLGILAARTH